MRIICTQRVAKEYGARIRKAAPGARLITPSMVDGTLQWSGDPDAADVLCFSADVWEDVALRATVIPAMFRLQGFRWFHTFSAGTDNPAFGALLARGVVLTNSSGASAPSIAQWVLAMMLQQVKRLPEFRIAQSQRSWAPTMAGELTGQTCGIIGTGAIGGEVARLAKACGMTTIGMRRSTKATKHIDESVRPARMASLLKRSDFVVLACPLTKQTEGLIGEAQLRTMKPSATLINISRGRVVVEADLIRALGDGTIAAACLDVFEREPLPETSELWDMPNVTITPHNSGISPLNMPRSMEIFLDNLARFAAGKPLRNRVLEPGL